MKDDAATESIMHFIGLFHLAEEQARLRSDYQTFKAHEAKRADPAQVDLHSARISSPHSLETYTPELDIRADFAPLARVASAAPDLSPTGLAPTPVPPVQLFAPPVAEDPPPAPGEIVYHLPLPSSLAAVIVQIARLSDNDWIGPGAGYSAAQVAAFKAGLEALEGAAGTLSAINVSLADIDGDWMQIVERIVEDALKAVEDTPEAASVALYTGADASGAFVDGEAVEDLPDWHDYMPAYLRDEDAEDEASEDATTGDGESEDGSTESSAESGSDDAEAEVSGGSVTGSQTVGTGGPGSGTATAGAPVTGLTGDAVVSDDTPVEHDFSRDFETDGADPFDVEDGHAVVSGANQLVNEATIYSTWLDAKVFAVHGDYVHFDGISQVNVLVEHDEVFAHGSVGPVSLDVASLEANVSTALNFASIQTISSKAPREVEDEEDDDTPDEAAEAARADDAEPAEAEGSAEGAEATAPAGDAQGAAGPVVEGSAAAEAGDAEGSSSEGDATDGQGSETADDDPDATDDAQSDPATNPVTYGAPQHYAVVRIESDVIQINWSHQHNFISDVDTVSFEFSGSNTFLGLGENESVNDLYAWELGFQYDLIFVGGQMIDVTLLDQMNVLLDSDRVDLDPSSAAAAAPAEAAASAGADVEDTAAPATASAQAAAPDLTAAASPLQQTAPARTEAHGTAPQTSEGPQADLAPAGAVATDVEGPLGTTPTATAPVGGDDPAAEPASPAAPQSPEPMPAPATDAVVAAPAAAAAAISTADNLLLNKAEITTIGEDVATGMQSAFRNTLDGLKAGGESIRDDVLSSGYFDGQSLLKVLYIDGDFKTLNVAEQTNVLGDSDQIELAIDAFAADLMDNIALTTGSNLLANLASVKDTGLDSTVMASGQTYSDAMIHQAELISPEMPDFDGLKADLANEAVAFLADDMIDPSLSSDIAMATSAAMADAMPGMDVMQTMLS